MKYNFTLLLCLCLLSFTKLSAANYYWVGGSGNWSDLSHWALTSGGSVHPVIVPSPFDDLYFDANSGFTPSSKTVTINVPNIFCKSMNWTGALNSPSFITTQGANSTWSIYGSLTFIPNMTYQYSGTVRFLSTNTGNTVTTGGKHFNETIIFDGIGGSWTLQDSISVKAIQLKEGNLLGNGNSLRVGSFTANQASLTLDMLDLSQSNIYMYENGSQFFVQTKTTGNPTTQIHLNTNFDGANFYFNYAYSLTSSRNLHLELINTTYINRVVFQQPSQTPSPQIGLSYDFLKANNKVFIARADFYNRIKVEYTDYLPRSITELIHVDSIFTYNNADYSSGTNGFLDYISDCAADYVLLRKNTGTTRSGNYGTVRFKGQGDVINGYFADVIIDENGMIHSGVIPNTGVDFTGTFVGKGELKKQGYFHQDGGGYLLQFDTLKLTAGYLYEAGDTITITQNGWLDAVGLCDAPIYFKAKNYGNAFKINGLCDTIKTEYTVLEYSLGIGNATFVALAGTDKEGNNGWSLSAKHKNFVLGWRSRQLGRCPTLVADKWRNRWRMYADFIG
ncbi:MAG: hypothetical protein HC803_00660 [Saprospiraceae bacterium]|nr:hypothetical protein [Saprospiraceae bacterium]